MKELIKQIRESGYLTDRQNGLLDLLENRSCKSCRYYYYDRVDYIALCENEDNNQEYLNDSKMQITSDFYCNKWETKND